MKSKPTRIVVLQRGWVAVGRFNQENQECTLEGASIVRRWGTTKGLGQLAVEGPLRDTLLDRSPTLRFHELTIVFQMDCAEKPWAKFVD